MESSELGYPLIPNYEGLAMISYKRVHARSGHLSGVDQRMVKERIQYVYRLRISH